MKNQVFWVSRSNVAELVIEATLRFAPHCLIIFVRFRKCQPLRYTRATQPASLVSGSGTAGKSSLPWHSSRLRQQCLNVLFLKSATRQAERSLCSCSRGSSPSLPPLHFVGRFRHSLGPRASPCGHGLVHWYALCGPWGAYGLLSRHSQGRALRVP